MTLREELLAEIEACLKKRFERVKNRKFAPLRLLRYRIMLKKLKRAHDNAK